MTPGKFTEDDKKKLFKFLKSKGFLSKDEIAKYDKQYGGSEKSAAFKQGFMDMMRKIAGPNGPVLFEQKAIDTGVTKPNNATTVGSSPTDINLRPRPPRTASTAAIGPLQSALDEGNINGLGRLEDGTPSVYDHDNDMPEAIGTFNQGVSRYLGDNVGIHTPLRASEIARNFLASEPTVAKQPYPRLVGDWIAQRAIDALPDPGPNVRQPTPYELGEFGRTLADRIATDEEIEMPGETKPNGGREYHEPVFDDDGNMVNPGWWESYPDGKESIYTTTPTQEALRTAFDPLLSTIPGYSDAKTLEEKDDMISDLGDSDASLATALSMLRADPALQDELARRAWNTATSAVPISVTSAGREPVR